MTIINTQQNVWVDIPLNTSVDYAQPFNDITTNALITTPSGKILSVPAFWRGDKAWCVRYSSTEIGEHTYITHCSNPDDADLHQQSGSILIGAYEGDNPLIKHGGIKIAKDKRHFAHQDDTPFFWLGDTWWMGLCGRMSDTEFEQLAQHRANQGFNLIQLVAGLYPDMPAFDERGKSDSGFAWEQDFTQINPAFYEAADKRIQILIKHGIVPCILGCWGYYLTWMGTEKMQQHWHNLMARWGALPIVWISSGEQTMPWYLTPQNERNQTIDSLKQDWSTVMQSMRQINAFDRLISAHPMTSARDSVNDIRLIDFEMQQTGHDQPTQHHADRALAGWHAQPMMPVISGESRYEALEISPTVTASEVRQSFWAHLIHSGLSGHTYGANGIWQVNLPEQAYGESPAGNNWGTLPWQDAMQLPGAQQLTIAKQFIDTLPWYALYTYTLAHPPKPLAALIDRIPSKRISRQLRKRLIGKQVNTPVAAAKTLDQQLAIYYTVTDKEFALNTKPFKSGFSAYWFDPTSGRQHQIDTSMVTNAPSASFVPFGKNSAGDQDWVLVLSAD